MIDYLQPLLIEKRSICIYHDRFGYLSTHLQTHQPYTIITFKSQESAILENFNNNKLENSALFFKNPIERIDTQIDIGIIKIPKSIDLFELYLNQLISSLMEDSIVIAGFMTRYFSRQALEIAQKYFEEVEQTKAQKKARLMILKSPKKVKQQELVHEILLENNQTLKQYYGVFSASKIDIATQFLMQHLNIDSSQKRILDLGCGNGVLAHRACQLNPSSEIYLTDDNLLAIESAKLNLGSSAKFHYYFTNHLKDFDDQFFDLIISNPPFHFEYENNIEITLSLFKEVERVLKPSAEFVLVANKHLNYKTHLERIFSKVDIISENNRFIIYQVFKQLN